MPWNLLRAGCHLQGADPATSIIEGTLAAQVEVTAGPVTITNITVDGTASSNCPTSTLVYAGIFYASGSSGTVNEVETRNQNCNGIYGFGILAENGAGATELVTIENSNINSNSYAGITAGSDQTPSTLTASIKRNYVAGGVVGIYTAFNVGGSVSGNVVAASTSGVGVIAASPSSLVSENTVNGGSEGIEVDGAVTVSGNTINGATYGVFVNAAGSVTSNNISNSGYGIYFQVNGATIKTNIITQAPVGIEFGCYTGTASGNTINGATTGIDRVPAGFAGVNKFQNVGTVITGGCGDSGLPGRASVMGVHKIGDEKSGDVLHD